MATSIGFDIYARDSGASSTFLKVAAASKLLNSTFSDLGSNTLGLTKLIGGAGLIPVLAGATGVVTELGTAFGAAALAGGVFALSAGKTFADIVKQRSAITSTKTALALLTPGTAAYATQLAKLHTQQKNFNADFGQAATGYNKMTAAFGRFQSGTSKVSEGVLGKAFALIASVLPRLVPVANAAGKAVGGLLDDLRNWTKSSSFTAVLRWLKDSGPKAITAFGHAAGNTIGGIGGILANFVGPGDKAAHSLERLTKRFDAWGNSKGVSASVDKFLKYISGNGGKINSVFASLASILPKLATALGGLGSTNLTAISMFLNLLAGMPQGVFDVVVKGLFAIAVASKLVSIAMGIQAAATAVMTGAQWALNAAMDANPIALVVIGLVALAAGLVIAYKKSATFRAIVQGAFHGVLAAGKAVAGFFTHDIPAAFGKVKSAAASVLGWVKSHWPVILAVLAGPVGLAVLAISKNWGKIKDGASAVKQWIVGKFNDLVGFVGGLPGRIGSAASGMFDGIKNAFRTALDWIIGKWNALSFSIPGVNTHIPGVGTVGGFTISTPNIPMMAKGGIVNRPTVAMIGERGPEAVVPLSGANRPNLGGDIYITVNASGLVDPASMAVAIEQELTKLRRLRGGKQPLAFAR